MSAQIIFLSLFLGLVSGRQPVALQVNGAIKSVHLVLGGRDVAVMTAPPWRLVVDFGSDLAPRDITAVGFDASGNEIARATQILNLPRPAAEFEIALEPEGGEAPTGLSLPWRHLTHSKPNRTMVTLDGKPLPVDERLHARLPRLDITVPHVVAAEMHFDDGFLARRELVIESIRSDSVGAQLTPILVLETAPKHPPQWDGCMARADGTPVRIAAVEKPRALVIVVRDPDPREVQTALDPFTRARGSFPSEALRRIAQLDRDTTERMLWPVAQRFSHGTDETSVLFEPSPDFDASIGMLWLLTSHYGGDDAHDVPRQFTDAVAVAGVRAITGAQRRAVVLVLSTNADSSGYRPAAVRRYLASIGVPLFVWSVIAPRPDLAAIWGEVGDISSLQKLSKAVARVRQTLEPQRIAWVDVDPLTALRLQAKASCGIAPVARDAP